MLEDGGKGSFLSDSGVTASSLKRDIRPFFSPIEQSGCLCSVYLVHAGQFGLCEQIISWENSPLPAMAALLSLGLVSALVQAVRQWLQHGNSRVKEKFDAPEESLAPPLARTLPAAIFAAPGAYRVLILGDGNFSFSLALARLLFDDEEHTPESAAAAAGCLRLGTKEPVSVVLACTSFDSHQQLIAKYPESAHILARLSRFPRVEILHNINAWQCKEHFGSQRFDAVLWNHPHLGLEDFRLHRFLMAHFFASVVRVMAPDGFVSITLVQGQETRWDTDARAREAGLGRLETAVFQEDLFPGYVCKRNTTGQSFKNSSTVRHTGSQMRSHAHVFCRGGTATTPTFSTELQRPLVQSQEPAHTVVSLPVTPKPPGLQHECPVCSKAFLTARGARDHHRLIHVLQRAGTTWAPNRPFTLPCPECDRSFADEQSRWQHCIAKHSFDKEIKNQHTRQLTEAEQEAGGGLVDFVPCSVCGLAIPSTWHMNQHLEMLKPLVGLTAECMVCRKRFIEHRALRQHLNFCRLKTIDSCSVAWSFLLVRPPAD